MAINRKKIIEDMSKLEVLAGENGIIEAFGVFINQLPTNFWNGFCERLISKTHPDLLPDMEMLLINAAQECGYHTGYGIVSSEEWKAIVQPMVENAEDILYGAYAVCTALGWAKAEITELIPGNRMVIRAYDYYEADIVKYGSMDRMISWVIRGMSTAFMALAYSGDYVKDRSKLNDYICHQVKGIECGDDYGEFVVEKRG